MLATYRRNERMKKCLTIVFSMLMLCCLLLGTVVMVQATEPGYDIIEAYQAGDVVIDGQNDGDWDPSMCWFENVTSEATFAYKMASTSPLYMAWIIDFPDNTSDAGDIWQILIDGDSSGGTAPTADCNKMEIVGHTTLTVYEGDGSGWVEMTGADVQWEESQQTTTIWGEAADEHYVLEIKADKGTLGAWGANQPPHGLRVAMYDETEDTWTAWPPTAEDVPDEWGIISSAQATVPEGFSLAVVMILSTVAVSAAFYFMRKRPKTTVYSAKTGI
jgi:hypothetical protein